MEAAFLCPLVQSTDQHGGLVYPLAGQGGVSSPAEGGGVAGKEGMYSSPTEEGIPDEASYDQDGNLKSEDESLETHNLEPEWESEGQEDGSEPEWDSESQEERKEEEEDKTVSNQR